MRSIGKKNIKKVIDYTRKWIKYTHEMPFDCGIDIRDKVREELPVELWDIWEMADQEIDRIIMDEINNYTYGGK